MNKTPLLRSFFVFIILLTGMLRVQGQTCQADFDYYKITYPLVYQFVDSCQVTGNILSWQWSFDDPASGSANASTNTDPIHQFSAPGSYNVCLIIQTSTLCVDTVCKLITVSNQLPIAYDFDAWTTANNSIFTDPIKMMSDSDGMVDRSTLEIVDGPVHGTAGIESSTFFVEYTPDNNYTGMDSFTYRAKDNEGAWSNIGTVTIGILSDSCMAMFQYYSQFDTTNTNNEYNVYFWDASIVNPTSWFWDFGDGSTSAEQNPVHTYATTGTYVVCLTISNGDCSDTYCDTIVISRPKAYLSGIVFRDSNGNGTQDQGEMGINNRVVKIWPGPVYTITSYGGWYYVRVDSGSYLIQSEPPSGWNQTAPTNPNSYTVTVDWGEHKGNLNFGHKPDASVQDLAVTITNYNGARPGFTSLYRIDYTNLGGQTMSGTVVFNHDPDLTYNNSVPTENSYSASTSEATWNFTNLQPGEQDYIYVELNVSVSQPLGDMLYNYVNILPLSGDANPSDNTDSSVVLVAGSYDPNDKAVQPAGLTEKGYIAKDQELTYTVRFQNTGNADAINVRVEDQLDTDLDISTLKVISASHSFVLDLVNSKKMIWNFNNINLPDSFSNEPASHGFIKYSIKPKSTVIDGDQIHNTADIYFDFNAPVVTNTTLNTFGDPNGIATPELITLQLSPNPVHTTSTLMLGNVSKEGYTVRILDVTGREVKKLSDVKQSSLTISREGLENGMYFIQVSSGKELIGKAKFVIH